MRRDSSIFETSVRSLINYYYYYAKLKISLYTCFLTCFFFTNTLNKNRLYQLTENKIYLIIGSLRFNLSGFRTSWAKFFQSFFLFFSTYHSITIIMHIRNAMYSPANDETLVKFEEFLQLFLKYRCAIKKMVITVDTVPWKNKKIRKKKTYIYTQSFNEVEYRFQNDYSRILSPWTLPSEVAFHSAKICLSLRTFRYFIFSTASSRSTRKFPENILVKLSSFPDQWPRCRKTMAQLQISNERYTHLTRRLCYFVFFHHRFFLEA